MINGSTKIVGLIGHPVEHSFSPPMHNAAFEELGLDYAYVPFNEPSRCYHRQRERRVEILPYSLRLP